MKPSKILEDWKNRPCVLATMHGKELVLAPVLTAGLGISTSVPENFDTDRFGAFTREVARMGNQLEAARNKAYAAMEHTGMDLAVASEGSFGSHPSMPFVSSNLEIVLLLDKKHGIEVVGHYRASGVRVHAQAVATPEEAVRVAQSWGFPEQGVIVRRSAKSTRHLYKDIRTVDELRQVCAGLLTGWFGKSIFMETDMRAHRCPARMDSIKAATDELVKNCLCLCPQCQIPGFVVTEVIPGLPCSDCGLPTERATKLVYTCQSCHYSERKAIDGPATADPGQCEYCNP